MFAMARNHFGMSRQIRAFYQRLASALGVGRPDLEHQRPDQLVAYYRDLESQLLTRWDAPLINDFFAMIFYGLLGKLTRKWCGDPEGTLQNDLICGEGGMISAEPADSGAGHGRDCRQISDLAERPLRRASSSLFALRLAVSPLSGNYMSSTWSALAIAVWRS